MSPMYQWPRWHGGNHPDMPFDKRWSPNHPEHVPGPWEQRTAAAPSGPNGYHIEEIHPGERWNAYAPGIQPDRRGWKYTPNVGNLQVRQHEGQPFVHWVGVSPDHRGQGIGQAMWERAGRPLHIPGAQTDEGKAWADKVGGDNIWWSGNEHLRPPGAV